MKKLFVGAAIAVSSLSFAQQFGVKAGANFSSISKDTWEDSKAKTGFHAGVFMNAPLAESFSIQPELLFSNLGAKTTYNAGNLGTATSTLNLNYITLPVMFQYNVVPSFYLEAGPEFGFMVSAKSKTTYSTPIASGSQTSDDIKDNFNTFNMGIGLGLGYNFTPNIGISGRYVAGLNDVTKNDAWGSDAQNKSGAFQVGLNYKF